METGADVALPVRSLLPVQREEPQADAPAPDRIHHEADDDGVHLERVVLVHLDDELQELPFRRRTVHPDEEPTKARVEHLDGLVAAPAYDPRGQGDASSSVASAFFFLHGTGIERHDVADL